MKNRSPKRTVIESNIIAFMKGDIGIWENRIKLAIIRNLQHLLAGKQIGKCKRFEISSDIFGYRAMTMYTEDCMPLGDTNNHSQVHKAAVSLHKKVFKVEDENEVKYLSLISMPKFHKKTGKFTFIVDEDVYRGFLNFSKGYKQFNIEVAMSLQSKYAQRFYELLSNQEKPLSLSLDEIKDLFALGDKYKQVWQIRQRIIDAAKKELDERSPVTFSIKPYKIGRQIEGFTFVRMVNRGVNVPVPNIDKDLNIKDFFIQRAGFTEHGYHSNQFLILKAMDVLDDDFKDTLEKIVQRSKDKDSPQGYIIAALQKIVK